MRHRFKYIVLSCLAILLIGALPYPVHGSSLIPANGTSANDATITDCHGQVIGHDESTSAYRGYEVTWHFSINNEQHINAGDQTTFTLPNNVKVTHDISTPVYCDGEVIGTFHINTGASIGQLIYNNYFNTHPELNRHGTITIGVSGTESANSDFKFHIHKVGWIDDQNRPTWAISLNPQANSYQTMTVTDDMSNNQLLDPSSVEITTGYYNKQGQWIATSTLPSSAYQIVQNGHQVTFVLHNVHSAINIDYRTKVTSTGATDLNNRVSTNLDGNTYTDSAHLAYGADGNIDGNKPSSSSSSKPVVSSSSTTSTVSSSNKPVVSSSSSTVATTSSSSSSITSSSSSKPVTTSSSSSSKPTSSSSNKPAVSSNKPVVSNSNKPISSSNKPVISSSSSKPVINNSSTSKPITSSSSDRPVSSSSNELTTSSNSQAIVSSKPVTSSSTVTTSSRNNQPITNSSSQSTISDNKQIAIARSSSIATTRNQTTINHHNNRLPATGNHHNENLVVFGSLCIGIAVSLLLVLM